MTYKIGDIFTNDDDYENKAKWARENNATISFYEDRLENVEKTRQVEKVDENGGISYEEETYTEEVLVRYYQLVERQAPSLDELKELKRAEINKARDETEQGGFEYMGKVFDSDQVSCIRISSAAQAMQYADDNATITWTCQDNSTIDLNKEQLSGLVVALAQWSNYCHQKATSLKIQIDACKSKEELDKIYW